jgi:hypothetical protein
MTNKELQDEEIVVLSSMFGDDFKQTGGGGGGGCVKVKPLDQQLAVHCEVVFEYGAEYPTHGPPARLEVVCRDHSIPPEGVAALNRVTKAAAERYARDDGGACIARLVDSLKEQLRIADTAVASKMTSRDQVRLIELTADMTAGTTFAGSFFALLTTYAVRHVFSFLDGRSLARCAQTCKLWNTVVSQDMELWSLAFARDFPRKMLSGLWAEALEKDPRKASATAWRLRIGKGTMLRREQEQVKAKEEQQRIEAVKTKTVTINPFELRPAADQYYQPAYKPFSAVIPTTLAVATTATGDGKSKKEKRKEAEKKKKTRGPLCGRRYY